MTSICSTCRFFNSTNVLQGYADECILFEYAKDESVPFSFKATSLCC